MFNSMVAVGGLRRGRQSEVTAVPQRAGGCTGKTRVLLEGGFAQEFEEPVM